MRGGQECGARNFEINLKDARELGLRIFSWIRMKSNGFTRTFGRTSFFNALLIDTRGIM